MVKIKDKKTMRLKLEHAIQIVALLLGAVSVYAATMAEIKLNTEKISSQKEYIERIDKNVRSLVDHFVIKGVNMK